MSGVWNEFVDDKTGHKYYANSVTNETTWEKPPGFDDQAKAPAPTPTPTEQTAVQVTTTSTAASAQPQDTTAWSEAVDPNTQRKYYFNKVTHETRWDPPPGWENKKGLHARAASVPPQPAVQVAENELYDRVLHQESGRYYYVHRATQRTQWEEPPAHLIAGMQQASLDGGSTLSNPGPTTHKASSSTFASSTLGHRSSAPEQKTSFAAAAAAPSAPSIHDARSLQAMKSFRNVLAGSPHGSGGNGFKALPAPLQADIQKFQMSGFAQQHFRQRKRGFLFKKEVPVDEVLKWQNDPIDKSLLSSGKSVNDQAKSTFKQLLRIMGDIPTKKSKNLLARQVLEAGMKLPQLRDEIFCQLCKQTTDNPSEESAARGWKLFILCVSAFAPSRGFEGFLQAYIARNYSKQGLIASMAPYAYWRLNRTIKKGPETDPSKLSLQYIDSLIATGVPSCRVLFGGSLEYIMELQRNEGRKEKVPFVLKKMCQMIMKAGAATSKGMFRLAADRDATIHLQRQFEMGNYEVKVDNPHTPGDLLKIWLRDLQDPLIPEVLYNQALKVCRQPDKIVSWCKVNLSPTHYDTLGYLMQWLRELAKSESVTSMGAENLAIVFCQNILQNRKEDPTKKLMNSEKEKDFVKHAIKTWPEDHEL